jgi:hypothetical protein
MDKNMLPHQFVIFLTKFRYYCNYFFTNIKDPCEATYKNIVFYDLKYLLHEIYFIHIIV